MRAGLRREDELHDLRWRMSMRRQAEWAMYKIDEAVYVESIVEAEYTERMNGKSKSSIPGAMPIARCLRPSASIHEVLSMPHNILPIRASHL